MLAGMRQRGEKHHMAKLTAVDVAEIRKLLATGMTCQKVTDQFNVSRVAVSSIKVGKSWKEEEAA
jgi:hypothetical protein